MLLFEYDSAIREEYPVICGVDEAGRGPLAGDVYAAAVIFKPDTVIDGINDSKKLSEKKRELLFEQIIAQAEAYCISTATVEEIDRLNILQASLLAMRRAVEGLGIQPDMALIDGNQLPFISCDARAVIKGDACSASIAAASILAKVSRDRYMTAMAEKYPHYQLQKHKGYGTKLHTDLILQFGPCAIHRRTFLKKLLKNEE